MSFHDPSLKNLSVSLVSASTSPVTTHYQVQVTVSDVQWRVDRRYSDFAQLNTQLLAAKHLSSDSLPPKKLLGNREPVFVERRRQELDSYLERVLAQLEDAIPECLAEFLAMPEYDTGWMLRQLAYLCYVHESAYLSGEVVVQASPMQLSALQRVVDDGRADSFFRETRLGTAPSHVVAVANGVPSLTVVGSWHSLPGCSVKPNSHSFSLRLFSALSRLSLCDVAMSQCESLAPLRPRLVSLSVSGAGLEHVHQVLLCGERHIPHVSSSGEGLPVLWPLLEELSLSDNCISSLDDTILMAPDLVSLDLSSNVLSTITAPLQQLPLQQLNLSNNRLRDNSGLGGRLPPSLQLLNLSANGLQLDQMSLHQLTALTRLDLSFNRLACVRSVSGRLPEDSLLELNLAGNPATLAPEYRLRALLCLPGARHGLLVLDNEHSTRAELDRVNTLHALAVARDGAPHFVAPWWRARQLCQL